MKEKRKKQKIKMMSLWNWKKRWEKKWKKKGKRKKQ